MFCVKRKIYCIPSNWSERIKMELLSFSSSTTYPSSSTPSFMVCKWAYALFFCRSPLRSKQIAFYMYTFYKSMAYLQNTIVPNPKCFPSVSLNWSLAKSNPSEYSDPIITWCTKRQFPQILRFADLYRNNGCLILIMFRICEQHTVMVIRSMVILCVFVYMLCICKHIYTLGKNIILSVILQMQSIT